MGDRTYLRWPFLDDAHRTFADEIDTWAAEAVGGLGEPREDGLDTHCRDLVERLADRGWLAPAVADPIDVRTLCLAMKKEPLGRGVAGRAATRPIVAREEKGYKKEPD